MKIALRYPDHDLTHRQKRTGHDQGQRQMSCSFTQISARDVSSRSVTMGHNPLTCENLEGASHNDHTATA